MTHDELEALVEALIEEARQRARRRRRKYGAAALVVAAVAIASFIGFGGRGGGGAGAAPPGRAPGVQGPAAGAQSPPLAALPPGAGHPQAFAFDPRRPNIVYIASAHADRGVYVYKTTDGGQHWHSSGASGTGWVSDILSLTADPHRPGTLYAGTGTALYKTVDDGRSWRPFNRGRRYHHNGWILDIAVDPIHGNVVYAAARGVRKSTDGGRHWKEVFVPRRWNHSGVSRIAIAPTRPESIYAIAHNRWNGDTAIYRSTDTGQSWHQVGGGSRLPSSCCWDAEDALAVDAETPQTLYAVIGNTVLATTDSGATWQPMMNGLPANEVSSLAVDPRRAGTIYASVVINLHHGDPNAVRGAIYKTTDGGRTWRKVFSGLGVEKVAVNPKRSSTIYAAGVAGWGTQPTFGLLRSTDSGSTWTVAG